MAEMKRTLQAPRSAKQLRDFAMFNLAACYAEIKPGSSVSDFLLEVMDVVMQKDNPSVIAPLDIAVQFFSPEETAKGLDWIAIQPSAPMWISAAYCARARKSLTSGYNELSWSNTADAMFWCGVTVVV